MKGQLATAKTVIASGKEGVTQFRWIGKEGQTVWTESYLSPMSDGNGLQGLRGVTLDITERKLAEEALRKLKKETGQFSTPSLT